jgi:hypothetical protein
MLGEILCSLGHIRSVPVPYAKTVPLIKHRVINELPVIAMIPPVVIMPTVPRSTVGIPTI